MDADVRAFCYALTYDLIVLSLALVAWIYIVRKVRRDHFRPSGKCRTNSVDASFCANESHWITQLWQWEIDKFASTDVYLYLLFLKSTALLFVLTSCLSMGVALPVIWTARAESRVAGGDLRHRSFFERAVITNVISTEYSRLWTIYIIVWLITIGTIYSSWRLYSHVRSDEFRNALTTKRANSAARKRGDMPRFMPSRYTVAILGLDHQLLDDATLRNALLCYFEDREILAVRIVMDYSEALSAHRAFQQYLSNLRDAQQALSEQVETADSWAIRLPLQSPSGGSWSDVTKSPKSKPNGIRSPFRQQPSQLSQELGAPLLESASSIFLPRHGGLSSTSSDDSSECALYVGKKVVVSERGLIENLSTQLSSSPPGTGLVVGLGTVSEEETHDRSSSGRFRGSTFNVGVGSIDFTAVNIRTTRDKLPPAPSPENQYISRESGSTFFTRCGRRRDSRELISHLEALVVNQYSLLSRVKSRAPKKSVGVAFVSFRHPEAVLFALSNDFGDPACPLFRARRLSDPSITCQKSTSFALWNPRWKVREAPPPEDIVWENIHVSALGRGIRRLMANLLILVFSLILTSSALAADALNPFAQHIENFLGKVSFLRMSVSGWIAPLFLYLINALLLPFLVAWAANASRFWRNSARDRSVLHANINFMVINSLIFPVIGTTSIQGIFLFLYQNNISNLFTTLGQLVAGASGSFMTRYVLNAAFINSAFQLLQLPMFSQQRVMLKLGKKPQRWQFDFGYWYAFHLSLFAVGLIFAVDIPLVPLMAALFFTAKFWVDKYNFAFGVWKVANESAGAVASTVVLFMFGFVAFFLLIMASYFVAVGLHAASMTDVVNKVDAVVTPIPIPDRAEPRALVIGGLVLLTTSVALFLATFAERAQRTILDHHAGKLRRIARAIRTVVARRLAHWGVVVPQREVVEAGSETPELNSDEINELRIAYTHPYEREDLSSSL